MKKISTKFPQVVTLASASQSRQKIIKKYFKNVKICCHKIDEIKIKKQNKKILPKKLVEILSKKKAESVLKEYPNEIIIGSDQILICKNKIFDKALTIKQAKENLYFLSGKEHELLSSIYVIKKGKYFFHETKKARIFFKEKTEKEINEYITKNNKTALLTVGAYKIEENKKFNFVKILSGDKEVILGIPIKNFLKKMYKEKK